MLILKLLNYTKMKKLHEIDLKKINSGNKLIAEFMGAEPDDKYPTLYFIEPHLNDYGTHDFYIENMKYHTSWDWLMPVVEKITKIRYDGEVKVDEQYCWAYFRTFFYQLQPDGTLMAMVRINRMGLHTASTLIEAAWNAIVEFIETDLK